MNQYIATFYSHFGAIRYKRICEAGGLKARVMPVPRRLSSSCGTCVSYEGDKPVYDEKYSDELEQIVKVTPEGYEQIYSSESE